MKEHLLALSIALTPGLIAGGSDNYEIASECGCCNACACAQTTCCSNCCCKCCEPQPTVCVSGVAYTVPYYDLQCDWGAFVDVEFLYWYARETELTYAAVVSPQVATPTSSDTILGFNRFKELSAKWKPGFRIGLGWNGSCDGWDLFLTYTWMRNQSTSSTSVPTFSNNLQPGLGQAALMNPWVNNSIHSNSNGTLFNKISAKWRLQWNAMDLELGRRYWLSENFNLRPFASLRGAWWETRFDTLSEIDGVNQGNVLDGQTENDFTTCIWGVGILGGIQPKWYLSCCFALYADLSVGLLWGHSQVKKEETIFATQNDVEVANYKNNDTYAFSQMTPVLDGGIGFSWEDTWCCDRYRVTLAFGWEHHIYFDENHRIQTLDLASNQTNGSEDGFRSFLSEKGNLGLGGFVLKGRFDF